MEPAPPLAPGSLATGQGLVPPRQIKWAGSSLRFAIPFGTLSHTCISAQGPDKPALQKWPVTLARQAAVLPSWSCRPAQATPQRTGG